MRRKRSNEQFSWPYAVLRGATRTAIVAQQRARLACDGSPQRSGKRLARLTCSVVNALATVCGRCRLFRVGYGAWPDWLKGRGFCCLFGGGGNLSGGGRRARTARTTQGAGALGPRPLRWFCGSGAHRAPDPQNAAAPRRPPGRPVRRGGGAAGPWPRCEPAAGLCPAAGGWA